jgi:hypothetical protein
MRGFDGLFLMEYLLKNAFKPQVIYSGAKLMTIKVFKKLNMRILDSLNFLPMRLSQLPKAFGVKELSKGWFPHFWNTAENQNYVGPYPPPEAYGADSMSTDDRAKFLKWHSQRADDEFAFEAEMLKYCRSDVYILARCSMIFRDLMLKETTIDPFDKITIASVCMEAFKTLFLPETWNIRTGDEWQTARKLRGELSVQRDDGTWRKVTEEVKEATFQHSPIAVVPTEGYVASGNFSKASIEWLEWEAASTNRFIQHAMNLGEKKVGPYRLDGIYENTAYEFHG